MLDTSKRCVTVARIVSLVAAVIGVCCLVHALSAGLALDVQYLGMLAGLWAACTLCLFVFPSKVVCGFLALAALVVPLYSLAWAVQTPGCLYGWVYGPDSLSTRVGDAAVFATAFIGFLCLAHVFGPAQFWTITHWVADVAYLCCILLVPFGWFGLQYVAYIRDGGTAFARTEIWRYLFLPVKADVVFCFLSTAGMQFLMVTCIVAFSGGAPVSYRWIRNGDVGVYERGLMHGYKKSAFARSLGVRRHKVSRSRRDVLENGLFGVYEASTVLERALPGKKKLLFNTLITGDGGDQTNADILCFWRGMLFVVQPVRYSRGDLYIDENHSRWVLAAGGAQVGTTPNYYARNWTRSLSVIQAIEEGLGHLPSFTVVPICLTGVSTGYSSVMGSALNLDYAAVPSVMASCLDLHRLIKKWKKAKPTKAQEEELEAAYRYLAKMSGHAMDDYIETAEAKGLEAIEQHTEMAYAYWEDKDCVLRFRLVYGKPVCVERLAESGGRYFWTYLPYSYIEGADIYRISRDEAEKWYYKK